MKYTLPFLFLLLAAGFPANSQDIYNYDTVSVFKMLQNGLKYNYNIRLQQKAVLESQGQMIMTKGAFNPELEIDLNGLYGTDPTYSFIDSYQFQGMFVLPTRFGAKFYTGGKLFTETQIQWGVEGIYPTQFLPFNEAGIWAGVTLPLMRDLGKNNSRNVAFRANTLMNQAQNVGFSDEICQFIKNTMISYYNAYIVVKVFKIQKDAFIDAQKYQSDIDAMIANEQIPKSESYRASAHTLNISQELATARMEIGSSFYDLITSIGMEGKMTLNELPTFLDSLPDPTTFPWDDYARYVFKNLDSMIVKTQYYKKQELAMHASKVAMEGAKQNKLNELNLDLRYMYFGMNNGMPAFSFNQTLSSGIPGSSVNLTLSYKFPFQNEEKRGDYLAKQSTYEFNKIALENLKFTSKNDALKLLSDLRNLIPLYANEVELARIEKLTYDNEVQKFRMGTSTQIDMINTYMDYNNALVNAENGRKAILSKIISLKYLIGDFPTSSNKLSTYNLWDFTVR